MVCLICLHLDVTEHWLDPMKGLEKEIPADWYKRYAECVPGLGDNSLEITGFLLLHIPVILLLF